MVVVLFPSFPSSDIPFLITLKAARLDCTKAIAAKTVLNVTNDALNGCSLPYSVNKVKTNGPISPNYVAFFFSMSSFSF